MFSVQDLLAGLFSTEVFKPEELPEAFEPNNACTLQVQNVRRLVAMKDGKHFVAAGSDGKLVVFETDSQGKAAAVLDGNMHAALQSSIEALTPLGDGVFVSGDNKALVTTWDAKSKEPRATIELYNNEVTAVCALTDDSFIVGTHAGRMGSFGHREGRALQEVSVVPEAHNAEVTALVTGAGLVVSASADRTVRVWDAETLRAQATLHHGHTVFAVDVDQYVIVTGCAEGEIRVYRNGSDYALDKILRGLHGSCAVRSVTLLGSNILMSTGVDGHVVFTDIFYQRPVARVQTNIGIRSATVLSDGRIAVCGMDDDATLVFEPPGQLKPIVQKYAKKFFGIKDEDEGEVDAEVGAEVDAQLEAEAEIEGEIKGEVELEAEVKEEGEKKKVKRSQSMTQRLKRSAKKKMDAAVSKITEMNTVEV